LEGDSKLFQFWQPYAVQARFGVGGELDVPVGGAEVCSVAGYFGDPPVPERCEVVQVNDDLALVEVAGGAMSGMARSSVAVG